MYVRKFVYVFVCTYVCMYVRVYVRMYVCLYACVYVCMYVCVCVCVCVCVLTWNNSVPTGRISMKFDFSAAQRDVGAIGRNLMDIRTSVLEVPLFHLAILFDPCLSAQSVYHWRHLPLQILM